MSTESRQGDLEQPGRRPVGQGSEHPGDDTGRQEVDEHDIEQAARIMAGQVLNGFSHVNRLEIPKRTGIFGSPQV